MPQHVWSILCTKASIDNQSNNVSLFEVIEQLTIRGAPQSQEFLLPGTFELVSLWVRTDPAVPESAAMRIQLQRPDGSLKGGGTMDVNLTSALRNRTLAKMNGLPLLGAGRYCFIVESKLASEAVWTLCARIPVEVAIEAARG